jgi:hypothetical protein
MSSTPRVGLPLLSAGQAQKEIVHNEALQTLDLLVGATVEDLPAEMPPASPLPGACYLVGPAPSGPWAGREQCIAGFTGGGWRFIAPQEGMAFFVRSAGCEARFRSGSWIMGEVRGESVILAGEQVLGARLGPIADPAGGATVDAEARAVLGQILAAMRQHGLIAP